ncbi:MOCOS family protein [Megaselia abdita]
MPIFEEEFTKKEADNIAKEFHRLGDNTYLDHAGTTLYTESQVDAISKLLKTNLFCNPHTCKVTGDLIDQVRLRILSHFNVSSSDYTVIFTSGATQSLRIVGECFDFNQNGNFYYCQENHTSVLGMREVVQTENLFVLRQKELLDSLTKSKNLSKTTEANHLVAFSAQCNFSGYKMPLDLINHIQKDGLQSYGQQIKGSSVDHNGNYFICLDAASFVASNFLDLSKYPADFVALSFYKIFGYPTGTGALLVSKRAQDLLDKRFYGGGTVNIAMTRENFHVKRESLNTRFEDGTLSFLNIPAFLEGFRAHELFAPEKNNLLPIQRISNHVFNLSKYCYESLKELKHSNGKPLVVFYNHTNFESSETQGGICTFNILHPDGSYVGFAEVACIAAIYNIHIRTGCFCNPGACQEFLALTNEDIKKQFQAGHICSDYNDLVDGLPTGAVRVSVGYMTTKEDIDRVVSMIRDNYLKSTEQRIELMENSNLPKALQHIPAKLKKPRAPRLKKICIYPIKSCGSFEITGNKKWELTENGLKYDRVWMIVDSNGMAVTQKKTSKLCLLKPTILENSLKISFPNMKSMEIPLESKGDIVESKLCQSKVCGDVVGGYYCGDKVSLWISECLDIPELRLIRQQTDRKKMNGVQKDLSLANQAQFLVVNYRSVEWLSSKIEDWGEIEAEDVDSTINRFRGNLLIETSEAFDENSFKSLRIGDVGLKADGFCTRCQMICINQRTGEKTSEPLKTIAKEFKGKIRFGLYMSLDSTESGRFISCGDDICIGL